MSAWALTPRLGGRSGFIVRQEHPKQFVVRSERAPPRRRRIGEQRISDPVDAVLMRFRRVCEPLAKRDSNLHSCVTIQHGRPAVGKTFVQLPHELPTHQSSELLAAFSLGDQPPEHLNAGNVIRTKILCKSD
ncbi:hypothetical protein BHS05_10035 [Myxococcus xanthus]|nr:hypothetical protein BHS05_10035 [Myxococcus xanthus]